MSQNSEINIAKNIKTLRIRNKITRENLSSALGFENSYISKLERMKSNITIEKSDKIADYFGIETKQLFE